MDRLVLVHAASDPMEAQLLRGRLEAEDIPVFTKGEAEGPYRMGPTYLWVREDHEVQARLVLAEVLGGRFEIPEDAEMAEPERPAENEPDPT